MPSSSLSSRMSAASGVSPAWTLPPGNSQSPAIDLPAGRSASRTRPSTSISATATTRTTALSLDTALRPFGSAPVAAIDVDVAVGQIAGPHGCPPPPDAEIDLDVEGAPGHVPGDRRLVVARHRTAPLATSGAADRDHHAVAIGPLA